MLLNIIVDVEDIEIKELIQKSLGETFGNYQTLTYQTMQRPIIIFKEVTSLQQLKLFKNKSLDHHSVVFIINDAEHLFASLEQYPLGFIRKSHKEDDMKSVIELIQHIHQDVEQVLTFKMGYSYIRIQSSQIVYIESFGHYLIVHTVSGEYRVREKLNHILNQTHHQQFTQIHKSYIVNEKYIKERKTNEIVMSSKVILPIGRKYRSV